MFEEIFILKEYKYMSFKNVVIFYFIFDYSMDCCSLFLL